MSHSILIVDDEEHYAEMLRALLEQHRFLAEAETKPEQALRRLHEQGFNLVITDYKMPVMDGAMFLSKIRDVNADIPVIIISGLMNTPELVKVANMGVTLVLEKPIDVEHFIEHVGRFVPPLTEEEYARTTSGSPQAAGDEALVFPDVHRVSAQSFTMRAFLHRLWKRLDQQHNFVVTPQGCETGLLFRDLIRWLDVTRAHATMTFPSSKGEKHLKANFAAAEENERETFLVGVFGFENASVNAQLDFHVLAQGAPRNVKLIYFIDQAMMLDLKRGLSDGVRAAAEHKPEYFPRLRDRLEDLSIYLPAMLEAHAQAEGLAETPRLAPDAAALLLRFPWEGNFTELADLTRALVLLCQDGLITTELVDEALQRTGRDWTLPDPSLERLLLDGQNELLAEMAARNPAEVESLLRDNGQPVPDHITPEDVQALPFLFPNLLPSNSN